MSETNFRHPDALVSTDCLEANLGAPALRVCDCTSYLVYDTGADKPYKVVSGRALRMDLVTAR